MNSKPAAQNSKPERKPACQVHPLTHTLTHTFPERSPTDFGFRISGFFRVPGRRISDFKLIPGLLAALAAGALATTAGAAVTYPIASTGQTKCYNNQQEIAPPLPGQPFYGQDAQHPQPPASYALSADGLTVQDQVTGLTWQRSPDTDGNGVLNRADKLTFAQAKALPAKLNAEKFGGFDDWRLPTIKELYSLFQASGTDPGGPMNPDTSRLTPFIDTKYFQFAYGRAQDRERTIDSQYATASLYTGQSVGGRGKLFGVNFADGRIKGYDLQGPGGRGDKTFFVLCVRGNPAYGRNDFQDHQDGTVSDRATGLMWTKADSARGLNWQEALAWAQTMNAEKFLGHADWRLPNVKELQSLVDYSRSPDATHSPAMDPVFHCTAITNENHELDYPFYWSGTTHGGVRGGGAAMYVAFGRAAGFMPPANRGGGPGGPEGGTGPGPGFGGPPAEGRQSSPGGTYRYMDVHGAGAQRSDPKTGDPALFPHGRGPQGDIIRIYNYVRLVRDDPAKSRS